MEFDTGVVYASAAVIVLLALAAGPLVGLIPVDDGTADNPGVGNATVTVVDAPDAAALSPGQHGADFYVLRVPAATVEVSALSGNPAVEYSLSIPALGYQRSSVHLLGEAGEGQRVLELEQDQLDASRIDGDEYEAQLRLVLRGDEQRTVLERDVTVEVEQ